MTFGRDRSKPAGPPDPVFPPGTPVRVARPDAGAASRRRGQAGRVAKVSEGTDRAGRRVALHVVEFDADLVGDKAGRPYNYGKVSGYYMGHELAAAPGGGG